MISRISLVPITSLPTKVVYYDTGYYSNCGPPITFTVTFNRVKTEGARDQLTCFECDFYSGQTSKQNKTNKKDMCAQNLDSIPSHDM